MQKIKIIIKINDYTIKENGIKNKDILKVKDKDENITFDTQNLILTKENKDLVLTLNFKEKIVTYELVKEKCKFSNNFEILSLTNNNKQVIINYRIEETDFYFNLNYETI